MAPSNAVASESDSHYLEGKHQITLETALPI